MLLNTFFQIQLDRITGKNPPHAPGPKKPTLSQQDYDFDRNQVGKIK